MASKQTRVLKLRFEKNDSTESSPCYYLDFEVTPDEVNVMVEADYWCRRAACADPDVVQRRDAQEILIEEVNKPEYNNAKKYHRHTIYRSVAPGEDTDPVSVIESELDADGYLASNGGLADPADGWVGVMAVWAAIDSLPERDRGVLVDVKLNGLSQKEAAAKYGVSQPRINAILKRATTRLGEVLK